jgi:HK97 family phage portal protein
MRFGPFTFFERKSLTEPTLEELELFTGGAVDGSGISMAQALTVPAVQSCIRLIAEAAASLTIYVERKAGKVWELVHDHPVAQLLHDQPNSFSSTFELIRDLVATALTHDKGGLALVNRVGGEIREIVRYEPSHFTVDYSGDGTREPSFRINNVPRSAEDVIFIRSPFSRSPLSLAIEAIAAAKNMERHASRLFEKGARPGGVIESPKPIGDEGAKKMITAWRKAHDGADKAGKTAILWDGATFKAMIMNSTDAQFLENRKYQTLEICRAFRVPPSMIYELDRATWSNGEQQGKEFLSYSLEAWLRILEGAMRKACFERSERADYRIRFDRDDLTRADLASRSKAISSLVSSRVINPNEGRDWLDMAPYDGGDEFANPHINPTGGSSQDAEDPSNTDPTNESQ